MLNNSSRHISSWSISLRAVFLSENLNLMTTLLTSTSSLERNNKILKLKLSLRLSRLSRDSKELLQLTITSESTLSLRSSRPMENSVWDHLNFWGSFTAYLDRLLRSKQSLNSLFLKETRSVLATKTSLSWSRILLFTLLSYPTELLLVSLQMPSSLKNLRKLRHGLTRLMNSLRSSWMMCLDPAQPWRRMTSSLRLPKREEYCWAARRSERNWLLSHQSLRSNQQHKRLNSNRNRLMVAMLKLQLKNEQS